MRIHVLSETCNGPNKNCKRANKQGRPVHVIALTDDPEPHLVMHSYHFQTVEQGVAAVQSAWATAEVIKTDAQLYEARRLRRPHKISRGWIDPSRRSYTK